MIDGNQTLGGRNANELADNILTLKQGLNEKPHTGRIGLSYKLN
jgi:hypothetical protein